MREPRFLEPEEIVRLHGEAVRRFGGIQGVRDLGGLISAAHAPRNHWYYSGGDLFDLAAVLLVHLARNHPFLDGNKRAALASALIFLDAHGVSFPADPDRMETLTLEAAQGHLEVEAVAETFRTLPTQE